MTEQWRKKTEPQTLDQIETALIQKDAHCRICGKRFEKGDIRAYKHSGGIEVKGFKQKQWVYMRCSGCGYDWALHKLTNQIKRRENK